MAQPPAWRSLPRRVKGRFATIAQVRVHVAGNLVRISRQPGLGRQTLRLDDPAARYRIRADHVIVSARDAADLVQLATSGLIEGPTRRITVHLAAVPDWVAAAGPQRFRLTGRDFSWRRRGRSLTVAMAWGARHDSHRAFGDLLSAVLRSRLWASAGGPIYALDRAAWLDGRSTWPQARLVDQTVAAEVDAAGRPVGPYWPAGRTGQRPPAPVLTSVANPYGRKLVGAATRYRLAPIAEGLELIDAAGHSVIRLESRHGPQTSALANAIDKYAVVSIDRLPTDQYAIDTLRSLGACGVVIATSDERIRHRLDELGLVSVADPGLVTDLFGYQLSVSAARRMAIAGDAALRRTTLAGTGSAASTGGGAALLSLPTVSILLSSVRADHIETCLGYLAAQSYPALEAVVGLHGYEVSAATRDKWSELLPYPLRIVTAPAEQPFGMVLGQLSRIADGDLVTKVDDDDHYGPHHVTDLFLAWHTTGADLVAKGSRFVHFLERDQTIDRRWTATEQFNVTVAGGTMMLSRATLAEAGGWSHSSRHVDADLHQRLRDDRALVYRTHGLEYAYVRRSTGHTWQAENDTLFQQGEQVYPGLPDEILHPADER